MKRFLLILISLFLMSPCFANDYVCGKFKPKTDRVDEKYLEAYFVDTLLCKIKKPLLVGQFSQEVDIDIMELQTNAENDVYYYLPEERLTNRQSLLQAFRLMNYIGMIPDKVDVYYLNLKQGKVYDYYYMNMIQSGEMMTKRDVYIACIKHAAQLLYDSGKLNDYRVADLVIRILIDIRGYEYNNIGHELDGYILRIAKLNDGKPQAIYNSKSFSK